MSSMAAARGSQAAVKVVFIQTHYVETDPMSFKSVVQSLTGKDSSVAEWTENDEQPVVAGRKRSRGGRPVAVTGGGCKEELVPVLMKEMSFKEFERLMSELPSLDELLDTPYGCGLISYI